MRPPMSWKPIMLGVNVAAALGAAGHAELAEHVVLDSGRNSSKHSFS